MRIYIVGMNDGVAVESYKAPDQQELDLGE